MTEFTRLILYGYGLYDLYFKTSFINSNKSVPDFACISSDTVQYIFEMNSYELTVDFLEKKIIIADELLNSIESYDLQKTDPAVYELYDKLNSLFMNINRY